MKTDKWKITAIVLAVMLVVSCICCAVARCRKENGGETGEARSRISFEEHGWIPISMRDDWTTIYGDGVTKK